MSGGFIQKLLEAAAETGNFSGLAHFIWTTIVFTKLSADFVPTELTYIIVLSHKTPLQQQFHSEYISV